MSLVRSEVRDHIGWVTLADPAHRNALSKRLSDDLAAAVAAVLAEQARVIVLDAEPPVFCAGGSLDDLLAREHPLSETYTGYLALAKAPVPTIAVVAGAAIGAGVSLPLACDVVLAGQEKARFDPRFLDVAIHPGGGHLWQLARRVGPQGAAALVLLGDTLTGPEAEQHGLAWRCVPEAELMPLATRLAGRAAGRPAALVARTKQTLRDSVGAPTMEAAHALELEAQEWSVAQPEFKAAVERIRASVRAKDK
jgi:enoyl-CoA hydratase